MSGVTCNFAAICVNSDCKFEHPITIKDRRVVKKLYDGLVCPNKVETNPEKRRANCRFGQICFNSSCGFRHRLSFDDRMKLVDGFNDAKLAMAKVEKPARVPKNHEFLIDARNAFALLDDCCSVNGNAKAETPVVRAEAKLLWGDMSDDEMSFDDFPALVRT